jgi:putative phosphoribosyl transferase
MGKQSIEHLVHIPANGAIIDGIVTIPAKAQSVVLIAHPFYGHSENLSNQYIAGRLHEAGFGTLLIDLLTPLEAGYSESYFDIKLLTKRLEAATCWLTAKSRVAYLRIGYFTEGTGTEPRRHSMPPSI